MTDREPGANPFVGPRPLKQDDSLFGRENELSELRYLLYAERIVLLHSPSGAGKSSLVQAGLLPRLEEDFEVWGPTRVGVEPPAGCDGNRYLLSALRDFRGGRREDSGEVAETGLSDRVEGWFQEEEARNLLLVFDQFEEIITVDPLAIDAKRAFFGELGETLRNPHVWALFILREDYLAPLDPYARQVPTRLNNRFRIDLLDRESATEAMANLAREGGREFPAAEQLARELAKMKVQQADDSFQEQIGPHVEPVQLQVVCHRLWDAMPPDAPTIEAEHVEKYGDPTEALGGYYRESVARIASGGADSERAIREWFGDRLITATGIRRQVLREEQTSGGLGNDLIEELRGTHLVRAEKRAGVTWYELAHDRLIDPVRTDNEAWLESNLSAVQRQASRWQKNDRAAGLLFTGDELEAAEVWSSGHRAELNEDERQFLDACRQQQKQIDRDRRKTRWIQALAVAAMIVVVIAINLRSREFQQKQMAERQAALLLSRTLASEALRLSDTAPQKSVLLALESRRRASEAGSDWFPPAEAALHQAISRCGGRAVGNPGVWVETAALGKEGMIWVEKLTRDEGPDDYVLSARGFPPSALQGLRPVQFAPGGDGC